MTKIIRAEFYKLFHGIAPWGIMLGYIFLCSILVRDHYDQMSFFRAAAYPIPFMLFLQIALAVYMIGHEFDQRFLQSYVASGNKRYQIFLGKLLVYLAVSVGMPLITVLIYGTVGQVTRGEAIPWASFLFLLPAFIGMSMVPAILAFIFKDIGKTLGSGLVFYLIMIICVNKAGVSDKVVYLPFGQPFLVYGDIVPSDITSLVLIDIAWIFVLVIGSYIAFRKSDLK